MNLGGTFDSVAELYERSRPGYPDGLFEALGPPGRAVDVGAGTGQATRGLVAHGWDVVAIEPGPSTAQVARRGLRNVEVVVSTFEDWAGAGPYDLVFAATSWHWVDPAVGYAKAARLLRPGGTLAIVATMHVLPPDGDLFFREVEAAYAAVGLGDGKGGPVPPEEEPAPNVAEIDASGLFGPVDVRRWVTEHTYTAEDYIDLLGTYSNHIAATEAQRTTLFADIRRRIAERGGTVRKHHLRILQTARKL